MNACTSLCTTHTNYNATPSGALQECRGELEGGAQEGSRKIVFPKHLQQIGAFQNK